MPRWRPVAFVVAALAVVFVRPLLLGTLYLREVGSYALPLRRHLRDALLSGNLPEWMPHMHLGLPFAADPSNAVFYPPHALLVLLPWPHGFDVLVFAHVALGALGAHALARRLGAGVRAALVGGLTFGLSGYVISMTSSVVYLMGLAWAPLGARVALGTAPMWRRLPVLAAVLALQVLAGDPQVAALTMLVAVALAAAVGRDLRDGLGRSAGVLLASALGLGIAAIQVVPALSLAAESVRQGGVPLHIAEMFSVHPLRLIELVAPGATGLTPPDAQYLGRSLLETRHAWPFAFSLYLGMGALVLTPLGVRGRMGAALLAIAVIALLLSLGRHLPLHALLWRHLPLWSLFRYPEKLVGIATLAVAMLAALGAERVGSGRVAARSGWVAAAVLTLAAFVLRASLQEPYGADLAGQVFWRTCLSAGVAAALALLFTFGGGLIARLLPLAVAADLGAHAVRLVDALPLDRTRPLPLVVDRRDPACPARGYVTANARARVEEASDVRELERRAHALALPDRRVGEIQHLVSQTAAEPATGAALIHALHGHGKRMLDLLSVEWLLQTEADPENPALEPVGGSVAGVHVMRNRDAAPRARMYFHTTAAQDEDAALRWIADPRFPASRVAIVPPDGPALRSSREPLPCRVTRYDPEEVVVECSAPEDALLVLSEQHLSGWAATVDAKPVPLLGANVALRAVRLGAGDHRVRFAYATPDLGMGAGISAASLALCLVLLIAFRTRQ